VLSTIVTKAVQLSGTEAGAIYVFDNLQREFRLRATYGMDQELIEALAQRHIGAYGDAETKRRALENGAEALLTKPIDFVMLRNEIDVLVEGAA
jgi:hypothetical protein